MVTPITLVVAGFCLQIPSGPRTVRHDNRGVNTFPFGTYTSCAQGELNPSGNRFLNASGFQDGAVLTLEQRGTSLTSKYVDQNGLTRSLTFSTTETSTAKLSRKGQVILGFKSLCVVGPGRQTAYPASMTLKAGTITYDAGIVFLTVTGSLESHAGECGALSEPHASFWVICGERNRAARPATRSGESSLTHLAGQYSCKTQIESLSSLNGTNHYAGGGGSGTLTLTAVGAKVAAEYRGDPSLSGTLRFDPTTPSTAIAEHGQTMMGRCMVPTRTDVSSQEPEPLHVTGAVLTLNDSTLFLSLAGSTATGSSCPGAKTAGGIVCAKGH